MSAPLAALLLLAACAAPEAPLQARWVAAVDGDDAARAAVGLAWSWALLGGAAPAPTTEGGDRATFTIDPDALGLDARASEALAAALGPLRASDEHATTGAVDLGRLLAYTLHSPGRYYAITGACATVSDWQATRLGAVDADVTVTRSLLVDGPRAVRWSVARPALSATVDGVEHEVVDGMANGVARYAVYGADGGLAPYALHTAAGQPGRCAWCHERGLQRPADSDPEWARMDVAFDAIEARMWATSRAAGVPVDDPLAHEEGERIVLDFLEPTARRVAAEWGVSVASVVALDLPTHVNDEYPDSGLRFRRADVDAADPRGIAHLATVADGRGADPAATLEGAEELGPCPDDGDE